MPLVVEEYLNNLRPQEDALRRFSFVSYRDPPMPYDGCTFEASKIEEMTDHQTQVRHPLMSRIERKYCLISTSCLTDLFGISILLYI